MAIKQVSYIPDPALKQTSKKVALFDEKLKNLIQDMIDTMRQKNGVGLSACQIGVSKKVVVIEYNPANSEEEKIPLTILINPKITNFSKETEIADEGCISVPGVELPVERALKITVLAQDIEGKRFRLRTSGLFARVIQHELDHLNGELFIEKAKVKLPFKESADLIFFGTPDFAVPVLELFNSNPLFKVKAVVTESDKPAGRGMETKFSPIKKFALDNDIEVLQPIFIRPKKDGTGEKEAQDFINKIKELNPDFCLVASYGKIIPKNVLEIPKYGFINIHPSLLPKYRGATPLQSTILNGDHIGGITIIKMDEGMDTGPIIAQAEIELPSNIDMPRLSDEMANIGAELALYSTFRYITGLTKPHSQKGEPTLTSMIKKEDGYVNLETDDPVLIERKIRAYKLWPEVYTKLNNKIIKITAVHLEDGNLIIDSVKPEGKREMDYKSYLLGNQPLV